MGSSKLKKTKWSCHYRRLGCHYGKEKGLFAEIHNCPDHSIMSLSLTALLGFQGSNQCGTAGFASIQTCSSLHKSHNPTRSPFLTSWARISQSILMFSVWNNMHNNVKKPSAEVSLNSNAAWINNRRGTVKLEEPLAVYSLSILPKRIRLAKRNSFIIQNVSLGIICI